MNINFICSNHHNLIRLCLTNSLESRWIISEVFSLMRFKQIVMTLKSGILHLIFLYRYIFFFRIIRDNSYKWNIYKGSSKSGLGYLKYHLCIHWPVSELKLANGTWFISLWPDDYQLMATWRQAFFQWWQQCCGKLSPLKDGGFIRTGIPLALEDMPL